MATTPRQNEKVQCEGCLKMISGHNMRAHMRLCKGVPSVENLIKENELLKQKIAQMDEKYTVIIADLEAENKKLNNMIITNSASPNSVNIHQPTINITNNNNFYVFDLNGKQRGLNMEKLRSFGDENIDYINKDLPLESILKQLYCNDDHLENKVISHEFLNLQWVLFKYKDHILSLNLGIDNDNFRVMCRLIVDNVQKLLNKEFTNADERHHAVLGLLNTMNKNVIEYSNRVGVKIAAEKLPIWNKEQFKKNGKQRVQEIHGA